MGRERMPIGVSPEMAVYRIEVASRESGPDTHDALTAELREAGLPEVRVGSTSRLYLIDGDLTRSDAERIAAGLLADPIAERATVQASGEPAAPCSGVAIEVHPRPGVMDPVAESTLAELASRGERVSGVRTGWRFVLEGSPGSANVAAAASRVLANDCIEQVVIGSRPLAPAASPPTRPFEVRTVAISGLDAAGLERLARDGHLFLSLDEMQTVQAQFRRLDREPTDLELETIAQTWSEHCVHKTLKSAIVYRGTPFPGQGNYPESPQPAIERRYANLLGDTIARATRELIAAGRGPECLSVFADNAGVIAFDDRFGIAFKVETHNHPSAIEPYGGAATGVGGCIRDVIGCGLGAWPIAATDVFCVAPPDWPADCVPRGALHPRRVLRGVVRGVADYGNRMGIPTVNGAVYFDPRYLGNPLVFCGCVGLLPRDRVRKAARPGDLIVLVGGRTGRDGIHGATFSSAELTGTHADEFSHAVQIGNAITERRMLDGIMGAAGGWNASDGPPGECLYSAITDCGAGGLSSAVGEMGAECGAVVDLEHVPLKYSGLRYDEVWISEAQERMVLAVPPAKLDRLMDAMRAEGAEATVIGAFGPGNAKQAAARVEPDPARLVVRYQGVVVGDLDMRFLHDGLPKRERLAEWTPDETRQVAAPPPRSTGLPDLEELLTVLASPNVTSRERIIRGYDHEVQGGSVVKPLVGPGGGPGDAAVLRPRLSSPRGIAIGCGLRPGLSDVDPYWMALASLDEALRNVVCVGGDPRQTAVLDNFCWGRCDEPWQLGALVRACQACYDGAVALGTPFISGKDSLNNEFVLDEGDAERVLRHVDALLARQRPAAAPGTSQRDGGARLRIPGTLLISALSLVPDVRRCVTSDLKRGGNELLFVGGMAEVGLDPRPAAAIHAAVADVLRDGLASACHDVSDGGWLVCVAEMAIGGRRGAALDADVGAGLPLSAFESCAAGYVIEATDAPALRSRLASAAIPATTLGVVTGEPFVTLGPQRLPTASLASAWTR